jgi:putative transposase
VVQYMVEEHGVSHRQACKAVSLPRSTYQYKPKAKDDESIISELQSLVSRHLVSGSVSTDSGKGALTIVD